MQFSKAIYEKYGIKVTDEVIHDNRPSDQLEIEVSFHNAVKYKQINSTTVKLLEEAVGKYPNSEALKNYLHIAYTRTGRKEEALDCLHRTVKLHPNYPFGIINLVNYYIDKNELDKASVLLKTPYDVRNVEKDEYINYSIFISYYQAVVRLAVAKSDRKVAEKYHRLMFDYDPKDKTVKEFASQVVGVRMSSMQKRMEAPSVRTVEATQKPVLGWKKTDKQPVFMHSEVQQLFEIDASEMPKTQIDELLALPRETFIQDLENVLADTIRRRDVHLSQTEWDGEKQSFPLHALYFLTELRSYDSLPTILNLLRQDQEFIDYWFSEFLHELFYPSLYILGNTQLPVLQAFVIESHNYSWARNVATNVATQTALRQPERRDEVVTWFRNVIQTHLDQADNDGIIDNIVLSDLVAHVLDFSGIELETQIVALFGKGWIADGICGDLEDVLEKLHKSSFAQGRINPLPASIYEMYDNKYSDVIENPEAKAYADTYLDRLADDPYDAFLTENGWGNLFNNVKNNKYEDDDDYSYRTPQETVKRVEPKVGRNDPCPCGSGKKYKKCHGA